MAGVTGPTGLFIGGEFVDAADGATIAVTSPHDGSLLAEVADELRAELAAACLIDRSPPPPPRDPLDRSGRRPPGMGRPTKRDRRQLDRTRRAQVVFPDADLDAALEKVVFGAYFNQGECCNAGGSFTFFDDPSVILSNSNGRSPMDLPPSARNSAAVFSGIRQ